MDTTSTLREAHTWLRWLTARSLHAATKLSETEFRNQFPIGVGSVHGTFVHLVGAERIWIGVLEGDANISMPHPDELPNAQAIAEAFVTVRKRWDIYLGQLDAHECQRVVSRIRDGKEFRQTVADVLMQIPSHALYHNAQLSFMFRSMGHSLPDSSWIMWGRERLAQVSS